MQALGPGRGATAQPSIWTRFSVTHTFWCNYASGLFLCEHNFPLAAGLIMLKLMIRWELSFYACLENCLLRRDYPGKLLAAR